MNSLPYFRDRLMKETNRARRLHADPLSPERKPVATVIDIKEGEKGISYARLFLPIACAIEVFRCPGLESDA